MFFIEVNLKEADGGFIVGCPLENTDHIFVTFSDTIDFVVNYFEKDYSNDPENYKITGEKIVA